MIGHKDFSVRPATGEDVVRLFGRPSEKTFQGLVAVHDGDVVAIGGVVIGADGVVAFSEFKEGLRYSPRAALRFAVEVLRHCARGRHVKAFSRTPNEAFLVKLGFDFVGPHDNIKVYQWKPH